MVHEVKFERNTRTGQWRGICTCLWCKVGTEDDVQAAAAIHDLEWEPIKTVEIKSTD